MPFNIDTRSIAHYLQGKSDAISSGLDRETHNQLLCCALARLLARDLSNQDRADNLRRIDTFAPDRHLPWVKDALAEGENLYEFCPCSVVSDQISHISDWIASAMLQNAAWLANCDEKHRPRKLTKLGSLAQAVREADKAMEQANIALAPQDLAEGDVLEVRVFRGGARIVQMLTPRALDAESLAMGHCIGHGAYDIRLRHCTHRYYSLRCKSGQSRATLEVRNIDNALLQCKGRRNNPLARRYMARIQEFIIQHGFKLGELACKTGLIEQDGHYYDIANLPPKLVWNSDLDLSLADIEHLPDDLTVKGNLWLTHSKIKSLPERLTVHGSLLASYLTIERIPDSLVVHKDLAIVEAPVTEILRGFTVGRNLIALRSGIKTVGVGVRVGGNLNLSHTPLESLPDNFTISGAFLLAGTRIRSLPKNLTCGALDLDSVPIETLPSCLTITKGNISLARTRLKALPENFRVPAFMDLSGAQLISVPEVMTIKKYVIVDLNTRLPSIPKYMSRKLCGGRTIPPQYIRHHHLLQPVSDGPQAVQSETDPAILNFDNLFGNNLGPEVPARR